MAGLRLLCVPYAGGGMLSFRGWEQFLPASVEAFAVQLPGREDRLREPAMVDWTAMMQGLVDAVAPLPAMPTVIFGHSLGAVVALELGRWMQVRQPGRLRHVFASGRPWPGGGDDGRDPAHALPDDDLLQAMDRHYGSLSTSLSHPEIRELVLPILRADLKLLDDYRYARAIELDCPLTVFAGRGDPATSTENLAGWSRETTDRFDIRWLDGAHFFIDTHRAELLAVVSRELGLAGTGSHPSSHL